MLIGIPKETAVQERRIVLTPAGVHALRRRGHAVLVEDGAGAASGFSNREFREVGADIAFSHEEILRRAELLVAVHSPNESESACLNPEGTVLSFLNLGLTHRRALHAMLDKGITALSYEMLQTDSGRKPILTAMSQIAGGLLPQIAGRLLESHHGGRGISLSGIAGIPPATVVIIGAGVVGFSAARAFSGIGASVIIMDRDMERLEKIDRFFDKRVITATVSPYNLERFTRIADVLIGAVYVPAMKTPHIVSEEQVMAMRPASVIIDVSIDQGGCIATSRPTTLAEPTFTRHGVIHFGVPNIPSSVARTASHALNNAVAPIALEIAEQGIARALAQESPLRKSAYMFRGTCVNPVIAEQHELEFRSLAELLNAAVEPDPPGER